MAKMETNWTSITCTSLIEKCKASMQIGYQNSYQESPYAAATADASRVTLYLLSFSTWILKRSCWSTPFKPISCAREHSFFTCFRDAQPVSAAKHEAQDPTNARHGWPTASCFSDDGWPTAQDPITFAAVLRVLYNYGSIILP